MEGKFTREVVTEKSKPESQGIKLNRSENIETLEEEAERILEQVLDNPENTFLTDHPENKRRIESFSTAVESLAFALAQIERRAQKTERFSSSSSVEEFDIKIVNIDIGGIRRNLEEVLKHAVEIGRGGDAFVVVDKSEIRELPPEICYKFAITETTPRGRNNTFSELNLQEAFYKANLKNKESKIGVPIPFYAHEVGLHKVIAMEKLNARSIDDIVNHGIGILPLWFDIDTFCNELKSSLDYFHTLGLYHRDMHFGNIMISQKNELEEGDKVGFIIDFGLSVVDDAGLEPYKKYVAGNVFTYSDDYGILGGVKQALYHHQKHRKIKS